MHSPSKHLPKTTLRNQGKVLATLCLSSALVFGGLMLGAAAPSAHAEETEVNVNVPTTLAITSHTANVVIDADNYNQFYTDSATITSTTNNPTGYTLTMADKDTNTSLVNDDYDGQDFLHAIDSITSSITVDGTGSNFTVNKWGYAKDSATTTFLPIPASTAAEEIKVTDGPAENSTTTVTFGTKVNSEVVNGAYEDTVVFSLTANAVPKKFSSLTNMQELAEHPEACINAAEHESVEVEDLRDGQRYTIFKAKDGNCWMGENLRYGVNPDGTGHPFVAADAALSNSGLNATKMLDLTYDATNPNTAGRIKDGASGMKTADNSVNAFYGYGGESNTEPYINIYQANDVADYDGQTKYGVLYNYCAVTGGTVCDTSAMSEDASGSVCPKGWKLPGMTGNPTGSGATTDGSVKTYNNLANSYGYGNTQAGMNGMFSSPINLLRSGHAYNGSLDFRSSIIRHGYYWSSTKYTYTSYAYNLYLSDDSYYVFRHSDFRYYGYSARCVSE